MSMLSEYTPKQVGRRIALLLAVPLLWAAVNVATNRPVDTRTKMGIPIMMQEPLGGWRFDEKMLAENPELRRDCSEGATGDQVYTLRTAYFRNLLFRQGLALFGLTLAIIVMHDGIIYYRRRSGKGF